MAAGLKSKFRTLNSPSKNGLNLYGQLIIMLKVPNVMYSGNKNHPTADRYYSYE